MMSVVALLGHGRQQLVLVQIYLVARVLLVVWRACSVLGIWLANALGSILHRLVLFLVLELRAVWLGIYRCPCRRRRRFFVFVDVRRRARETTYLLVRFVYDRGEYAVVLLLLATAFVVQRQVFARFLVVSLRLMSATRRRGGHGVLIVVGGGERGRWWHLMLMLMRGVVRCVVTEDVEQAVVLVHDFVVVAVGGTTLLK